MIIMIQIIFCLLFTMHFLNLCTVLLSYYCHFTDGKQRLKEHKLLDFGLLEGSNNVGLYIYKNSGDFPLIDAGSDSGDLMLVRDTVR